MNQGEVNPTHAYCNGSRTSKDNEDPSWNTSSRPRELRRQLQLWKRFGRLHLIVFVLVRNIIKIYENLVFTTVDCCSGGGGSGGGSVDVVLVVVVKLEGTSTNVVRALKKFVLCKIFQICLWIIDSGCSKHMTSNCALLTNFVDKFLGTVRFGNNDFAVIAGYGDVGLEVAFRKSSCFVRTEDGVDLLTGDRSSNLYTIALNVVASNSSTCLLEKASSS
nr:hypothetical protein [Tanacetum cinerariifolium]